MLPQSRYWKPLKLRPLLQSLHALKSKSIHRHFFQPIVLGCRRKTTATILEQRELRPAEKRPPPLRWAVK